ncbi:Type 2A phosphatase-associated protein 42 [Paramarasmius palmivorus]|uniref:Type 2A phosphatase-associated protein 42 n=1 Tax=Paramarasmius palmivorus TaxID=297713 RepID=A0AAW0C8M0_9AGAR
MHDQYLKSFLSLADEYQIVPQDEIELHERKLSSIGNPAARRELKLKQYQKEKDLRARIEVVRKRRNQPQQSEISNDFDLIASLLPSPNASNAINDDDDDDESDQVLREATLLLIRLGCAQAHSQLQNMEQELELLRIAPPRLLPPRFSEDLNQGHKDKQKESDRDMWKLDLPSDGGPDGKGPLMDPSGKPLRAFTILPSDSASRARVHAQVFQPGHNLPTMTIDEYLEIERQRGRIISGGGPASEAALTTSEQLALDSEMDGTRDAEDKSEAKRQKDERWAVFTDVSPRGTGNTMNRG